MMHDQRAVWIGVYAWVRGLGVVDQAAEAQLVPSYGLDFVTMGAPGNRATL